MNEGEIISSSSLLSQSRQQQGIEQEFKDEDTVFFDEETESLVLPSSLHLVVLPHIHEHTHCNEETDN